MRFFEFADSALVEDLTTVLDTKKTQLVNQKKTIDNRKKALANQKAQKANRDAVAKMASRNRESK